MEYLVSIIDSLAWPLTVLGLAFLVRKPLKALIPLVESFKYKDVEVSFRKKLLEAQSDAEESGIKSEVLEEERENILKLAEISPASAIIESWKEIELAAKERTEALAPVGGSFSNSRNNRPIDYLELTGALVPSTARAIREMRHLRNQAAHSAKLNISRESVIEYVTLAKAISNQISSITSLPKQKLTVLTLLILEYNQLLDSGKYNDITIDEVHEAIKRKDIIPWLAKRTAGDSDFSLYTDADTYSVYLEFYYEQMANIYGGYAGQERRKWGVENLGLCVLIAWTNEIIQQGSGWHPYEE